MADRNVFDCVVPLLGLSSQIADSDGSFPLPHKKPAKKQDNKNQNENTRTKQDHKNQN